MSRKGMVAAEAHGAKLPEFASLTEAQAALFGLRDAVLNSFIAEHGSFDYSPDSLLLLERKYIEGGRPANGRSGYSFPLAIGFSFGEVLCRHAGFHWVVDEYVFLPRRYEIGVRQHRLSLMLTGGKVPSDQKNSRMDSLLREYRRYAP